jgi:hypothetical protein
MNSVSIKAMTPEHANPLSEPLETNAKQSIAKQLVSPWALTLATCLLLATSGGVRFWRDSQFRKIARDNEKCPLALDEFPKNLGMGVWYTDEKTQTVLDPEIARIAGANSHLLRTYVHKESETKVLALILYGRASSVFGHTPEVCYPASGYQQVMTSVDHQFTDSSSPFPAQFRSAFFSKNMGPVTRYEEVYYTFYHNDHWLPEVAQQWKLFRYHPGMFKVLLQRQTTDLSTANSPTESLLKEIVREINVRMGQPKPPAATEIVSSKTAQR